MTARRCSQRRLLMIAPRLVYASAVPSAVELADSDWIECAHRRLPPQPRGARLSRRGPGRQLDRYPSRRSATWDAEILQHHVRAVIAGQERDPWPRMAAGAA